MIETIKRILGISPSADFAQLVKEGAVVLDVRTRSEYASGHIKGSLNIPVDQLEQHLGRLPDKGRTVITCCASGMRSSTARAFLKAKGYQQVFNGGSWVGLRGKL